MLLKISGRINGKLSECIVCIASGLSGAAEVFADPDRRRAIERGLELLHPGDALLIAGKGHESTQQIGDVKHPFSDQQTVREILGCA